MTSSDELRIGISGMAIRRLVRKGLCKGFAAAVRRSLI